MRPATHQGLEVFERHPAADDGRPPLLTDGGPTDCANLCCVCRRMTTYSPG
jgi:hypothetical protein